MNNILELIDLKNYEKDWNMVTRYAIRGIIKNKEGKLAMIKSSEYGDLKFPGGGMEAGETEKETLIREVSEETGLYVLSDSITYYGTVLERKKAYIEKNSIFEQQSNYYFCSVDTNKIGQQKLDAYEERRGYHLVWVTCEDALQQMEELRKSLSNELEEMPWLYRDYIVMKRLLKEHEL